MATPTETTVSADQRAGALHEHSTDHRTDHRTEPETTEQDSKSNWTVLHIASNERQQGGKRGCEEYDQSSSN
jgi:hypothetical protein